MTTEVLGTLLGVQAVAIGFLIRAVIRLGERAARLEGRLNGAPGIEPEHEPRFRPVD